MLHRFIFANFSKGPPATNRESPRGEGRGEGNEGCPAPSTFRLYFAASPPRVALSFLRTARAKNIPLGSPEKRKGEFFTRRLPCPLAAGGQRRESGIALRPQSRRKEVTYRCQSGRREIGRGSFTTLLRLRNEILEPETEARNAFRQIWQAAVEAGRKGEAWQNCRSTSDRVSMSATRFFLR
jgi:hypothetical protein